MKLSMWMIANRITSLEPELHIREDARQVLKSARLAYATDCAIVTAQGTMVVCYDNENSIILKRMALTQGFELIQSVFDFYQDWLYDIKQALSTFNYQKAIDLCWTVFHNPIILFNGNHQVLAMSQQYLDEEMDEEWTYIEKYGYPSLKGMKARKKTQFLGDIERAQYFPSGNNVNYGSLSSPIRFRDKMCGRIVVIERDRPLNPGDAQLISILVDELRLPLAEQRDATEMELNFDCISSLIDGRATNPQSLALQLSSLNWKANSTFKVCKIRLPHTKEYQSTKEQLILESLRRQNTGSAILRNGSYLYMVQDIERFPESQTREALHQLVVYNQLYCAESLPLQGIHNLHFLREQADYAMDRSEEERHSKNDRKEAGEESRHFASFYRYAIDYLICSGDLGKSMYAVHPGLLKLWYNSQDDPDNSLDTYICYLKNGRSLKKTSEQLFLHRNTLVYRINKMNEQYSLNAEDAYTEDYISLSLRVLKNIERKKNKPEHH